MAVGSNQADRPTLFICTTCKRAETGQGDDLDPEGKALHDAIDALLPADNAPVTLVPIICLANCDRGCSAAISAEGKWSYVLGFLGREHAADLLAYAASYANSANGVVWRSQRSESLRHAIIARFPTHLDIVKDAAE